MYHVSNYEMASLFSSRSLRLNEVAMKFFPVKNFFKKILITEII